eukprot:scaffold4976_cov131-Isochrysis_galbana.AAC.8
MAKRSNALAPEAAHRSSGGPPLRDSADLRLDASMAAISAESSSESIVCARRAEMKTPLSPPTCKTAAPTEPDLWRGSTGKAAKRASVLRMGE